jgi:uncharacterized protein (DUF1015 family)
MAIVRPFRALRPRIDLTSLVASPPYDVLDSAEARELARDNPYSFLHINKPEIDLAESINPYDERVYQKGSENLQKFCNKKILIQDRESHFYVYRQIMGNHQQIGLVCCVSLEEYEKDLIKKHELTRQEKEDDRVKHMVHLNAQVGPVFLTYRQKESVDKIINDIVDDPPESDFNSDSVQHTIWIVKNKPNIQRIIDEFSAVSPLYVADGHHRSASALRVKALKRKSNPNHTGEEEYNFFLAVLFPHNQMQILDYNRVVKDLNGLSKKEFLTKIEENFIVQVLHREQSLRPEKLHHFSMYLDGSWYKLQAKLEKIDESDPVRRLDQSILQENLLSPILGIRDLRKEKRIDFVGGIRGLQELEKRVDQQGWQLAFAIFPTSIEELMEIADAGKIMPPKSTWFEPKLKSGLFIHLLD